jgi:hypothetical protein
VHKERVASRQSEPLSLASLISSESFNPQRNPLANLTDADFKEVDLAWGGVFGPSKESLNGEESPSHVLGMQRADTGRINVSISLGSSPRFFCLTFFSTAHDNVKVLS